MAHFCKHGHIKNSVIQTEEKSAKINYLDKEYDFQNGEEAIIFTCYQYCKEQKRGHVHIIKSTDIENMNENLKSKKIRRINDNLYECKCEYFWKTFLKFRYESEFGDILIKEFNKCPIKCSICERYEKKTVYCDLDLWHEEWHKFPCGHKILPPCHTIFIIDKSLSMKNRDMTPNLEKIKKNDNFNNRLGCVIHIIDNYVKKRFNLNKNNIFSFKSFNENAQIDLKNFNFEENKRSDLIKSLKHPSGGTSFYKGLLEAKNIILKSNRKQYKTIIILLSDGDEEDTYYEDTINIVNKVSIFLYKLNL